MGGDCSNSQFWDVLLKTCKECDAVCFQKRISKRCSSYCVSARCKALHGHYYDSLVKKCMNCTKICGRHPAACSQHCHASPMTTQTLLLGVTPHAPTSGRPAAPEDSALVVYSLLAVCMLLLFSSLSLALAVLLRGKKVKSAIPLVTGGRNRVLKTAVQPRQEVRLPGIQEDNNAKVLGPGFQAGYEAADDSIPTETCVCIHCFPDLNSLSQANDRPWSDKISLHQPSNLQRNQNSGPVWTEESRHYNHHLTPGPEDQAGPGVG